MTNWLSDFYLLVINLFEKILCFSQPNFQTSTTHKFVMDLALNQFIFNCINFVHLIHEHQALGAHTDIIVFQATTVKTYRWSHPGAHSMGNRSPIQCTKCHCLKTLSPKRENENQFKIVLRCSKCKWENTFEVPEGFRWCQGESLTKGVDSRGAWMVLTEPNPGDSDSKASKSGDGDNIMMDIAY